MKTNRLVMTMLCVLLASCVSSGDKEADAAATAQGARVNTQLGREYMSRGQYEVALEKLKKAIAADENYAPAHTMLAVLYETIGEDEKAGEHYREAVRSDPEDGDVNNNYGAFLCRSGSPREAEQHFLTAIDDPFYQTPEVAMANAGSCQLEMGNVDKAEAYLRNSLEYDQNFPNALLALAGVSIEKNDYLRARGFIQRFESSAAATAESLKMGFDVEMKLNNRKGAKKYADQLVDYFPDAWQTEEVKKYLQP